MSVTVRIPTQLRELSGGNAEVSAEGGSLASVLQGLETAHPGFRDRLFDAQGVLSRHHRRLHARALLAVADEQNGPRRTHASTLGG